MLVDVRRTDFEDAEEEGVRGNAEKRLILRLRLFLFKPVFGGGLGVLLLERSVIVEVERPCREDRREGDVLELLYSEEEPLP